MLTKNTEVAFDIHFIPGWNCFPFIPGWNQPCKRNHISSRDEFVPEWNSSRVSCKRTQRHLSELSIQGGFSVNECTNLKDWFFELFEMAQSENSERHFEAIVNVWHGWIPHHFYFMTTLSNKMFQSFYNIVLWSFSSFSLLVRRSMSGHCSLKEFSCSTRYKHTQ